LIKKSVKGLKRSGREISMVWLFISIILGALGQVFLKIASGSEPGSSSLVVFYRSLAYNYKLWLGMLCYGLSFIIWLRVLSKYDLSFARPFVGLGYVITAIFALFSQRKDICIQVDRHWPDCGRNFSTGLIK
jgi:multidrug transporter EmrE-like cation transporter